MGFLVKTESLEKLKRMIFSGVGGSSIVQCRGPDNSMRPRNVYLK